jgi:multiple antibiotic resistance protein
VWKHLIDAGVDTFAALLPLLNLPVSAAIFLALTSAETHERRRAQARRAALATLLILIAFLVAGRAVLVLFGISLGALQVAGALIVGYTGWQMLTNSSALTAGERSEAAEKRDVAIVPMAFPILAGPGAIGVLLALSALFTQPGQYAGAAVACLILGGMTYTACALGEPLVKRLGETGLGALQRLFGLFILAIAVDLATLGIAALRR